MLQGLLSMATWLEKRREREAKASFIMWSCQRCAVAPASRGWGGLQDVCVRGPLGTVWRLLTTPSLR